MTDEFGMRSATPRGHCGVQEPHDRHEWLEGSALRRECPGRAAESHGDASGWAGWWSWPPHGDVTVMPGVWFDVLADTLDEPDDAPELERLAAQPRRFNRPTGE